MIEIYLEIGKKKTFASAVDWPGWCRSGRDEETSLLSLLEHAGRYEGVLVSSGIEFHAPDSTSDFTVLERLEGNAGTDFGAPSVQPPWDSRPVDAEELERLVRILQSCWSAFDNAVQISTGKELSTGPRGGGRDLDKIVGHALEAERAYLTKLGWKYKPVEGGSPQEELLNITETIPLALGASARGELPTHGPRGGAYWGPRFYARYAAWHVLDHTWEIENRSAP
jgi:hypothetical protein